MWFKTITWGTLDIIWILTLRSDLLSWWVVLVLHFVLICLCPFIFYWDKRQQITGRAVWQEEPTGGVGCVLALSACLPSAGCGL